MSKIKAPFNFVPLSDNGVFFPEWADKISQDVPFSDSVSGTIELEITAKTPIFVRNGHTKDDSRDKTDKYKSFSKTPDGQYFIPSTSIKGCIRNVFEIMSFGKMTRINNVRFSIRNLTSKTPDNNFYKEKIKPENIHCGWLWQDNGKYYIDDCGLPWRISAEELDGKFGCGLEKFDKHGDFKDEKNRTALKKYELFESAHLISRFSSDENLRASHKNGSRQFVRFDASGDEGEIVFTGQPGIRKLGNRRNKKGELIWTGKYYEFVFPSKILKSRVEVDHSVIEEFQSIYKNSPDYKDFRKAQFNGGDKIPVFFSYQDDKIDSIGLSYMYKYPTYNSVRSAMRKDDVEDSRMDLAECVFGEIENEHQLRGRVQFCPAFVSGEAKELGEKSLVLSSPHPSYYPLYLGNGQTWNSEKIRIAGWKRCPVRNHLMESPKGTGDMVNIIKPLSEGTVFKGKLHFHNLRKVELGALLSAILFHGEADCFHNIGSAKSLGYGKIKVDIKSLITGECDDIKEYLDCYEDEMNRHVPSWRQDKSILELFSMAKGIPEGREQDFSYMHMDTDCKENEFIDGRVEYSNGEQLGTFTQIIAGNVPSFKFVGNVSARKQRENFEKQEQEKKEKEEKYKKQEQEKKEKEEKYKKQLSKGKELYHNGDFIKAKAELVKAKEYTVSEAEINLYLKKVEDAEEKLKKDFNDIISHADQLFSEKKYEEAKAKYVEAGELDVNDVKYKISECDSAISKLDVIKNSSIENAVTCSSQGAFAGSLKKWISVHGSLSDDDCRTLGNKLRSYISGLNKGKQKEWREWKKWKPIIKLIGDDNAKTIYSLI